MTLKAVIDSEDDVPENLRDEYVERDGKWYLDIDDTIRHHTSVSPLATSLATVKREKADVARKLKEANDKLAAFPEDFDAEKYEEIKIEYERLQADPNYKGASGNPADLQRMKDQYEQRIKNLETKHAAEIADRDSKLLARDNELNTNARGSSLAKALAGAGVKKEFMRAAEAMLGSTVKVVIDEETGARRAIVETDLGEVDVEQYVNNWAKSDEGKVFVAAPSGGDAPGSDRRSAIGENPFSSEQWNVTAQGDLYKKDQAKAERLAKAAGTSIGGPKPAPRARAA